MLRQLPGLLVLLLAGCATNPHSHGGALVSEYGSGEVGQVTAAPYSASYALYRASQEPCRPSEVRQLRGGEPVGFETDENGHYLLAVAGKERLPLEQGEYCWHITPETQKPQSEVVLRQAKEIGTDIVLLPARLLFLVLYGILAGGARPV